MAIQAQFYPENPGFSMEFGNVGLNQFSTQQKLQEQQQLLMQLELQNLYQQQQNKRFRNDNDFVFSNSKNNISKVDHQSMTYGQNITAQVEKQRQEIDNYIKLQNERLRLILQEQGKQQISMILKKVEFKTLELMKQKDEEIAQVTKRTMELEEFLRKLEMENQIIKRIAQENEAMVVSLNNTLEQVRERACCCVNNGAEDAESCCDMGRENDEEKEKEKTGGNRVVGNDDIVEQLRKKTIMACKVCNSRSPCMLLVPCRHLCSCKACEPYLDHCPVCKTAKKFSIETFI